MMVEKIIRAHLLVITLFIGTLPMVLSGQNPAAKFFLHEGQQSEYIPLAIGQIETVPANGGTFYHFEILDPNAAIFIEVLTSVPGNTGDPLDRYDHMFLYVDQTWQSIPGTEQYTIFPLRVHCIEKNLPQPPIYVPIDPCHVHPCADAWTIPIEEIPADHEVLLLRRAFFWENSEQLNCDIPSVVEFIDLFASVVDVTGAVHLLAHLTGIAEEFFRGNSPREALENILVDLFGYAANEITDRPIEALLTILYNDTSGLNGDGGWIDPHGPYGDIKLNICPGSVDDYSHEALSENNSLWSRSLHAVTVYTTCSSLRDAFDCNPFDNHPIEIDHFQFSFESNQPCEELSMADCLDAFRKTFLCQDFSTDTLLTVIDTTCWVKECNSDVITSYQSNKLYGPIWNANICGPNPHNEWVDGPWGCTYSNVVLWDWDNGIWPDEEITLVGSEADSRTNILFFSFDNPSDYLGKKKISRLEEGPILVKLGVVGWVIVETVSVDSLQPREPSVEAASHYWYPDPIWDGHYPAKVIGPEVIDMNGSGFWYSGCVVGPGLADANGDDCVDDLGFLPDTRLKGSQYLPYHQIAQVEREVPEYDSVAVYGGVIPPETLLQKQLTYVPLDPKLKFHEMQLNLGSPIAEAAIKPQPLKAVVSRKDHSPVMSKPEIWISPNPTNDWIHWQNSSVKDVQVFNTNGQLMLSAFDVDRLDLSLLPQGIYFIRFKEKLSGQITFTKVVKN